MYWGMGAYGRKKKLTAPRSVVVKPFEKRRATFYVPKNALTMKEWLKHIQLIYNNQKIDYIEFSDDSHEFDIDDIKEVFGNITDVYIENTGCFTFNQMILEKFFPIEKLFIKNSSFQNSKIPESILSQNFLRLDIGVIDDDETITMTLDDLLLLNSKVANIENLQMTPKHFNKFIKLWQKGSNPRLEYLSIGYPNVEGSRDFDNILNGIKYNKFRSSENMFQSAGLLEPEVIDGMNIHRYDGTKATIGFGRDNWSMAVWMDHCIA
ncbi:hypothetical protein CAEBREN_13650 [Caenorhabditis brenneri]|uniref:Sdz-33 F-box domain-containing protein n=1 Tax=Caenorhabditis brenneri TaxID=135651 RepID=G0N0E5_CAEBE|nr:hypothetical protein CAEBREN_13650 [Caenorhabditis brenneri]